MRQRFTPLIELGQQNLTERRVRIGLPLIDRQRPPSTGYRPRVIIPFKSLCRE